jgi:hypothetical protein
VTAPIEPDAGCGDLEEVKDSCMKEVECLTSDLVTEHTTTIEALEAETTVKPAADSKPTLDVSQSIDEIPADPVTADVLQSIDDSISNEIAVGIDDGEDDYPLPDMIRCAKEKAEVIEVPDSDDEVIDLTGEFEG